MAMQIMIGVKRGTEVLIDENQKQINYTETLREVCSSYFENMKFTEDNEEIVYSIIEKKNFLKLLKVICKKQEMTISEIKKTRGNEKKDILINESYDYTLLLSIIGEALSLSEESNETFILLV